MSAGGSGDGWTQEMAGPLFLSFYHLPSSGRSDKTLLWKWHPLTGPASDPKFAHISLAQASHKANPRVSVGQDYMGIQMHEGQIHWKSFLLQSDTGAKSGNRREQLGGSTIIQKETVMDCTRVMTMGVLRCA